jgi:hypothetical protein
MSGTISPARPTNPGLDYEVLRTEGIALVQAMSAQIWTDYNYSDPGVTILEQLCYALTELSYRAEFPVEDLLGAPETGRVVPVRQGLYPARAIMPVNPVTADDLRRLIIDRVRHVGNAWFTPVTVDGVRGLYRIDVLVPALDPDCCDDSAPNAETVQRRVLDCYVAHRGLCEDVHEARVLLPLATMVAASVQIGDHADANAVLAELLFRLGVRLSPEPKRAPLAAAIAAGRTTSEIFTGPLMLRGFIEDDQLAPRPDVIAVDDLLELMAETPGVLSVADLRVRVLPDPAWHPQGQTITLPEGTIARLAVEGQQIRLLRGDAVSPTDPARVRRLLERHWAAQRRTYDLWPEYAAEYAVPPGQTLDLAAYSSVQDQFPAVYGIGEAGLPAGAPTARRAASRQLKGYLMPFDQLMADFFSQLAFVRDLFSPAAGGTRTYAFQSLRPIVPGVEPLLEPGYEAGLAQLIADTDKVHARQADVLGLLLSLYGQTLTPATAVDGAALVKARRALLLRVVPASRDRGRGFDYRHGGPRRGMAGMEISALIELALLDGALHRGLDGNAAGADPKNAGFARRLEGHLHETVARGFLAVDFAGFEAAEEAGSALAGQHVAPVLLAALADPGCYRMGKFPDRDGVTLVCQDLHGGWWVIGHYPGVAEATAAAHGVWWAAGGQRLRLTVVEWTLLRDALPLLDCDGSGFTFRISAVLAAGGEAEAGSGWRRQVWTVLRQNTPAHIVLETVFLGRRQMHRFELLHREWVRALRHGSAERKATTSLALVEFLGLPGASAALSTPTGSGPSGSRPTGSGLTGSGPLGAGPTGSEPLGFGSTESAPMGSRPLGSKWTGYNSTGHNSTGSGSTGSGSTGSGLLGSGSAGSGPPGSEPTGSSSTGSGPLGSAPTGSARLWSGSIGSGSTGAEPAWSGPIGSGPTVAGPAASGPMVPAAPAGPVAPSLEATSASGSPFADAVPISPPAELTTDQLVRQAYLAAFRERLRARRGGTAPLEDPAPLPAPVTEAPARRHWWQRRSRASSPSAPGQSAEVASGGKLTVQTAAPGLRGFDTATVLTAADATSFAAAGFRYAIRYVSRTTPEAAADLSAAEATAILQAGLALMAVQHCEAEGWTPSEQLGTAYGQAAAANAAAAGLLPGVNLWLDLEGVASDTAAQIVVAYCNAWYDAVAAAGYLPGLYVGVGQVLTGEQLYYDLKFQYYWTPPSQYVPTIAVRGSCLRQTINAGFELDGIAYDEDMTIADTRGHTPVWLVAERQGVA